MIGGHGNDIHRTGVRIRADFSSNVAGREPHPALLEHLARNLKLVASYPEPFALSLRKLLAARHGLKPSQVLVTNGSTEAFYLIASAFREKHSRVFVPSFAEYEDACRLHRHRLSFSPVRTFDSPWEGSPDLVWLGNPNNPDGTVTAMKALTEKLSAHPETLFVVDEAYGELCTGFVSACGELSRRSNLLLVRSMTKLFCIPGLRLGYVLGAEERIRALQDQMQPWSVNSLAIEAGKYILGHEQELQPDTPALLQQSIAMQQQLSRLNALEVLPSPCSYFTVRLKQGKAAHLKQHLLQSHGFLIRDASNFRGLNERFFRLAAQDEALNLELVEALAAWLETPDAR